MNSRGKNGAVLTIPIRRIGAGRKNEKRLRIKYLRILARMISESGQAAPVWLHETFPGNGKRRILEVADLHSLVYLRACQIARMKSIRAIIIANGKQPAPVVARKPPRKVTVKPAGEHPKPVVLPVPAEPKPALAKQEPAGKGDNGKKKLKEAPKPAVPALTPSQIQDRRAHEAALQALATQRQIEEEECAASDPLEWRGKKVKPETRVVLASPIRPKFRDPLIEGDGNS